MTALFTMMMDKAHTREYIRSLMVRDISDLVVLRKLRVLQMTVLSKCPKIKLVHPRSTKDMGGEVDEYTTVTEEQNSGKQSTNKVDGATAILGGRDDVTTLSQKAEL
jgi:hypothetical protein